MSQCADACGSIGSNFRMLVEPSDTDAPCDVATFGGSSTRFEILKENLAYTDSTIGSKGLTGTLDPIANHLRAGSRIVYGNIAMEVGPNELEFWLPKILGNSTKSANNWSTGEQFELVPVDILVDREGGQVIYRHCIVAQCVIAGTTASQQDPDRQVIKMVMTMIGLEEHDSSWPGDAPALPSDPRLFWLFGDSDLLLEVPSADTSYNMDSFNLSINNMVTPKTRNHLQVTCLRSEGRDIRLGMTIPYTAESHAELYIGNPDRYDNSGILTFLGTKNLLGLIGEDMETTFTFDRLYQTRQTPSTPGKAEIPLSLDFRAYRTVAAEPLVVTNIIDNV